MLEEINHYYLGYMGIASAIVLSGFGAAYGTAKTAAGIFQTSTSQYKPISDQTQLTEPGVHGIQGNLMDNRSQQISQLFQSRQNHHKSSNALIVPVIMSGVLAIYGLIVGVILSQKVSRNDYSAEQAYSHLASGLSVGFACLTSGIGIGKLGNDGAIAVSKQPKTYVGMILMLIFTEAIGLYGLIVALLLQGNS